MKSIIVLYLFALLLILSCINQKTANNTSTINITGKIKYCIDIERNIRNVKAVPLSDIGGSIDYIVLETTPNNSLRSIDRVAFSDSFIFVNDHTKLLKFDRHGRFVRQIGSYGRGPSEYSYLNDFFIDQDTKNIYILGAGIILVFDFHGVFIRSFKVERNVTSFDLSDTNKLLLYPFNMPVNAINTIERPYSWYLIDMNGTDILKIPNYYKRTNSPGILIRKSPLYSFGNTFHFMEYGADTLYRLRSFKPEPYALFRLGEMKLDYDPAITKISHDDKIFEQKLSISSIIENKNNIFFRLNRGFSDTLLCGVFDKNTLNTYFPAGNVFRNDIDGGMDFWPEYTCNDTLLVDCIDSYVFLKNFRQISIGENKKQNGSGYDLNLTMKYPEKKKELIRLAESLKDTDNPVLILVRLKQ